MNDMYDIHYKHRYTYVLHAYTHVWVTMQSYYVHIHINAHIYIYINYVNFFNMQHYMIHIITIDFYDLHTSISYRLYVNNVHWTYTHVIIVQLHIYIFNSLYHISMGSRMIYIYCIIHNKGNYYYIIY